MSLQKSASLQLSSTIKNESDPILDLAAFIRSVGINRSTQHMLLLGAGASISSGVPSAANCVWEWKRAIFLTKNPGLEAQFAELSLPAVRAKIHRWLDAQNIYPANDSPEEYGVYIKACYPIADDRRSFFQDKVRQAVPHTGYRLAIKLAEAGILHSVWTTNFDGLIAKSAAQSKINSAIEVGIDCQERLPRKANRHELICVSLHGDYRYDLLKNTPEELQQQEKLLREALIDKLKDTPLLVVGYSGRDASVMGALEAAYSTQGTGGLYWCGYGDGPIPRPVKQLLDCARANGRSAYYIQAGGFDDLMLRIALHCLEGDSVEEARGLMMEQAPLPTEESVDFALIETETCGIIKSNAFQFTPPSEIYEFSLKEWPTGHVWDYFDSCTDGRDVVAAPFKGNAYAFGTIDDIRNAFSDRIGDKIERVPINDLDLRIEDGVINSLIRKVLVRAMAARAGAKTDGYEFIWNSAARERRKERGSEYLIFDAVVIYLRRVGNKSYAVLKPTIRIETTMGGDVPEDAERSLKMAILGWQHNNKFNYALEGWRRRMLNDGRFEFPFNCGSPFRFSVMHAPVLAKIMSPDLTKRIQVQDKFKPHIRHAGVELTEPNLIFSNRAGTATVTDPHPVRGIIENQPFDYSLSARKLTGPIQIGVICPAKESKQLSEYLQRLHQPIAPGKYEADYLLAFNGFQSAFGTPLQIPAPGDHLWLTCPEIDTGFDEQRGALQLSQHVTTCLNALKAAALPNITIIFIPTRWARWRKFETASERFDLHDFVKAFCAPQGIATQFLEEDTLENELQCRIRWWLSLALYVKSMRTPWVLSSLDADSAFVGLGISLDRKARKGNQVILGCSHLYNAHGQGLQFRLSKIEDPVIRNKSTFMSYEDARRVGETIRQLFWESQFRLPERVVIHKQTPFMPYERKGLQAGLSGVKHIDLLEIHIDSALRYLASVPQSNDTFKVDGYPVKRGTLLRLDNDSALLWVNGVSRAINPKLNYYQGKRRIPAPLVIRRHSGGSDLRLIGEEILGLSKMNWNSFDLYTKLPATVETSKQIAKIGALLERFASGSYDYRLFM
jgi:hypothetical protein